MIKDVFLHGTTHADMSVFLFDSQDAITVNDNSIVIVENVQNL